MDGCVSCTTSQCKYSIVCAIGKLAEKQLHLIVCVCVCVHTKAAFSLKMSQFFRYKSKRISFTL